MTGPLGLLLGAGSGGGGGSLLSLLHFGGADGSSVITDEVGLTAWTCHGSAGITTAQKVFGTGSLYGDGVGDSITADTSAPFNLVSSDLSVELRFRPRIVPQAGYVCGKTGTNKGWIIYLDNDTLRFYCSSNGSTFDMFNGVAMHSGTLSAATWYAIALTRSGNNFYGFLDGVVTSLGTSSAAIYSNTAAMVIGAAGEAGLSSGVDGNIDEFRLNSGFAYYTSNYTPASSAFTYP